jgi:aryl-alcohol dehydrogenase-like predicted oxidoreductase
LLEIGRPWAITKAVPGDQAARRFLEFAFEAGVRVFDTAPSYALSEARLGDFLKSLTAEQRADLFIATKSGETWNFESDEPETSHSYEALRQSVDRSLELLGRIDLLQVHKATPDVLLSGDLARAIEYASELGIPAFGASVKDLESAHIACTDPRFLQLQFPYNAANRSMRPAVLEARGAGRLLFLNRPFNMGALLASGESPASAIRAILAEPFDEAILFGTASEAHLAENLKGFREAAG